MELEVERELDLGCAVAWRGMLRKKIPSWVLVKEVFGRERKERKRLRERKRRGEVLLPGWLAG